MNWESSASAASLAPPQEVWDVLLDGRRWSFWNPGIEWLWLEGEAVPGTLATLKVARMRQTACTIEEALEPARFALRLTVGPVARMSVAWTIAERGSGSSIAATVAIAGVAAGFLLARPARRIARALPAHLERLAARAAAPVSAASEVNEKNTRLG